MAEDEGRQDDDAGREDAEDQDDDAGTGGDEDDEEDEFTPPSREEWTKVQNTLTKIKAERAAARKELREAKAAKDKGDGKDDDKADAPDPDLRVKRLAGVAALAAEGLTKAQAKVAVRLLDLDDVEVDDDGDADLEDAIAELKETFPGLFSRDEGGSGGNGRRPRTAGGRRDAGRGAGSRQGADGQKLTEADEKATQRLLRSAGYR